MLHSCSHTSPTCLPRVCFIATRLVYCIYFLGWIINLSGISPANRSRSGPNSVYADRSRGDNVQGILIAIGLFWAKLGLGRVWRSPSFFSATSQRPIFTKLGHARNIIRCSVDESWKTFSIIFTLGVIFPRNLKSQVGQTGTSLRDGCRARYSLFVLKVPLNSNRPTRAGYRSRDALQRGTVYSTL